MIGLPLWTKVAAGVVLAAAIAWLAYDYAWRGGEIDRLETEQTRLEGELREAVLANESLQQARKHDAYRHQRELASMAKIAEAERVRGQQLVDLAKRLAALPADQDCVGGEALQDLIDSLRGGGP